MTNESAQASRPWYRVQTSRLSQQPVYRFYIVQFILISIVSLPTVFFVDRPVHTSHENRTTVGYEKWDNKTWGSAAGNLSDSSSCNSPLVYDHVTRKCRGPCAWTSLSDLHSKILYSFMIVAFWIALFATIFTAITWASISNLRKYPHVLRFYLMICCTVLACCKMLPLRMGLDNVFCGEHQYWIPSGLSSKSALIQGALSHYFSLAQSFWAMCFVTNTYQVIVRDNKTVFNHPISCHLVQSLFCWITPILIVGTCLVLGPGYKFLFVDFLVAGPGSPAMTYYASTLPIQISLGICLCLLWSIIWCLRKARLDSVRRVIRSKAEHVSMRRVERQFVSIAVVILLVVGVVLTIGTILLYRVDDIVHRVEIYFDCLQVSTNCKVPSFGIIMSAVSTMSPGFLCMVFFFLLFFNKDCRQIWTDVYQKLSRLFAACCPFLGRLRDDGNRSRCSSTLTVLSERRDSCTVSSNFVIQVPIESKPRSASSHLRDSTDVVLRIQLPPHLTVGRTRCLSSPARLLNYVESGLVDRNPAGQHTLQVNVSDIHSIPGVAGTRQILDSSDEQMTRL